MHSDRDIGAACVFLLLFSLLTCHWQLGRPLVQYKRDAWHGGLLPLSLSVRCRQAQWARFFIAEPTSLFLKYGAVIALVILSVPIPILRSFDRSVCVPLNSACLSHTALTCNHGIL